MLNIADIRFVQRTPGQCTASQLPPTLARENVMLWTLSTELGLGPVHAILKKYDII
jgi:hypothetical protein